MLATFQTVLYKLFDLLRGIDSPHALAGLNFSTAENSSAGDILRLINAAFLIALCGENHPASSESWEYLEGMSHSENYGKVAEFYLEAIQAIESEINSLPEGDPKTTRRLDQLAWQLEEQKNYSAQQLVEMIWSFFHPEATGIWGQEKDRIADLREKRKIRITEPNPAPLNQPARQVLFTSNVLLTLPPVHSSLDALQIDERLQSKLAKMMDEPQRYWYDHPIQIGVKPEKNEILYGLGGLQSALEYELQETNLSKGEQLTCVLSVSVTHNGLHSLAREYLTTELQRDQSLPGLNIFVFTEDDCLDLIRAVLAPAAKHYLGTEDAEEKLHVFGVDGAYGRHYSFLKAIAAFWSVLIDPQIKGTFKIDLDQVFPQEVLHETTGMSAFEHLKSPLWGASGLDANGQPVELGMIAGALVNEGDIQFGLFTPDVPFPPSNRELSPDEWVFFSQLPQALSTGAEMMARYDGDDLDGVNTCLQRVHVTGGTNGILVDSLKSYRPFTPSFIGRAEDQAYILSTMAGADKKLAYLHQPGLIMRHDKQAFAQEAIQAAQVGKLIGDYERILYFSAYARAITPDLRLVKDHLDPFTGSFISYIPTTLTLLRFALKAEALYEAGETQLGEEFIELGSQRISQAIKFAKSGLHEQYRRERQGWVLYYETLLSVEKGIRDGDPFAEEISRKARQMVAEMMIKIDNSPSPSD